MDKRREVGAVNQQEFAGRTEAIKARLYRTAYLYLGNEDDALEPALFETWITRILINACHNELRRRKRFHPGGDEALPDTAGPDAYEHLPLKEAIRRLPEELRSVVILRFFSGCTQAETAAALRIPQGTAATRQKRALALLKLELGEEEQV